MSNRGTVTAAYFLINLLWAKSYYQQTGQLPSLQPNNRRFIYDEILKNTQEYLEPQYVELYLNQIQA